MKQGRLEPVLLLAMDSPRFPFVAVARWDSCVWIVRELACGRARTAFRSRRAEDQAVAPSAGEGTRRGVGVVRARATGETLNPFTISHTPMNNSHWPPGIV